MTYRLLSKIRNTRRRNVSASQQNLSVRGKSHSNGLLDLWN